jgi:hypothetical protein
MVRVRNQSALTKASLRVLCDGRESARQDVELPPTGEVRDYFLSIDPAANMIRAQIDVADDFAGDNSAFLVRRGSWPILEARTPVFAELARLIEKYSKLRPSGEESKRVAILRESGGSGPEIILAKPGSPAKGKVEVIDHPITKSLEKVDWPALAAIGIAEPVGDGWKAVLRIGGKAALAVREAPARQVWMGLNTQPIANTPEFVILWSNIFDWVGEGGEEFVAQTTGDLERGWTPAEPLPDGLKPGWWAGIYRRSDGALLAVNAPDVVPPPVAPSNWKTELAELANQYRQTSGMMHLTTPLILAAMALMLLAAITWRGGLKKMRETEQQRRDQDARVTV